MADPLRLQSQFYIQLDGADAPEALTSALVEVSVESSLHLPDVAALTLHDPALKWIDEPKLEPGKTLRISAMSRGPELPLFDGEIVELEPDFEPGIQRLVVRAFDRLHRLSRGRHVRSFLNVTDGDIIKKLAEEVGLTAEVGATGTVHPYVLQANETNLEFLRRRAATLGYLLYVKEKKLHCLPPQAAGKPVDLQWGQSLREFHPRLTTVDQVNAVTARGWDPDRKEEIIGQAQAGKGAPEVGEKRPGGDLAKSAFQVDAPYLVADRPLRVPAVADQLAQATANLHAGAFIEAEGVCGGQPNLVAGASANLVAVGDRFSGTYFVTAATHLYSAKQGYVTRFSVSGGRPTNLVALLTPETPPTTGSPALVIGIVTDNQDPENQGRVKVKYPWLSSEHASHWARVVSVGAGAERGIEFLPEVNDEVLVGFEQGDMQYPYILGGLWNGKDAPPKSSSEAVKGGGVNLRVIRSRAGHIITLDDTDGASAVSVVDRNGNKIVLDSAQNALQIEVQGDATIKAQGNMTLEAQGQVRVKGMGVNVDGGSGTVDVKGSLINLN